MKPDGCNRRGEDSQESNMRPSLVAQQQRQLQMGIYTSASRPASAGASVPAGAGEANQSQPGQQHLFDQDGLVLPKRHPVPGQQPIIRDLNRELKFNQVRGRNVLEQKSELKRAMERLEESKRKKEAEAERLSRRSSLELRLEERLAKSQPVGDKVEAEASSQTETKASCAFGIR